MHIQRLTLQNFRCFDSYVAEFDGRLTLLVGANGSGKSALLSAIRHGTSVLLKKGLEIETAISETEVRHRTSTDAGGASWSELEWPCSVSLDLVSPGGQRFNARIERHRPHEWPMKHRYAFRMPAAADKLGEAEPSAPLPLFAHIGAKPLVPVQSRLLSTASPFESRKQVYEAALTDEVDTLPLIQWFQHNELRTLQEGAPPAAYAEARRAVLGAIHASDIRFIVKDNRLMLLHEGEGWRPFDQLSDGQKRIAGIFCELALRCATLNSHLGDRCIDETPGIVTIDELDLHLHPQWQRTLIGDLVRTFPKLQFITASHSPFLLQAAFEHGKVLDVSKGEFVEPMDRSIEDIAESVMGIAMPQRSRRFLELKAKAQEFYELLEATPVDEQQRAELKARLDEAMVPFANDPAAAAWLDQRRLAAGH
jgi:predicted ATP-binding protein involved in virulence